LNPSAPDRWSAVVARLGRADLDALARQGFVSTEVRADGARSYKLRWRAAGRQRVLSLGKDPAAAAAVRAGLADLQADRRAARELSALAAEARTRLARAKRLLAPRLVAAGLYYHGYVARRPRVSRVPAGAPAIPPLPPGDVHA
jgi:hypothetical protein